MRLSTVLVATASADMYSFVVDNFWNEAVNVFNFAETNWNQFASAANSVSKTGQNHLSFSDNTAVIHNSFRSRIVSIRHFGKRVILTVTKSSPKRSFFHLVLKWPRTLVYLSRLSNFSISSVLSTGIYLTAQTMRTVV